MPQSSSLPTPDPTLTGQRAIVTGASRGIGKAVALALASRGASIALVARSEGQLRDVTRQIDSMPGDGLPMPCDVANADDVEGVVDRCADLLGGVDILVNNAGVFLEAPITDIRLDDWEHTLQVNATAPFLFCKHVLPRMIRQKSGKIINISSTSGTQGYMYQAAYCASKHALLGFARCLALEAKPHGIHVHTICPGGVDTDFIAGTYLAKRFEGQTMLRTEDVADLVLFAVMQPVNVDMPEIALRRFHVEK